MLKFINKKSGGIKMSAIFKLVEAETLLQKFADFYDAELEARPDIFDSSDDPSQDYKNQIAFLELCKEAKELLEADDE